MERPPLAQPEEIAAILLEGFDAYVDAFQAITQRAKAQFEAQDWHGIQADHRKRLRLYKQQVPKIARKIVRQLREEQHNQTFWAKTKAIYAESVHQHSAYEIAETFYNSVCRKVYRDIGANPDIMFVVDEHRLRPLRETYPIFRTYNWDRPSREIMKQILQDYAFEVPYEDIERDADYLIARLEEDILFLHTPDPQTRIEILNAHFFRNKGAYIVGRLCIEEQVVPFIIPLLQNAYGVYTDTLITDQNTASIIFSFTRSYFLVDLDVPSAWVYFLKTLMPLKPYSDLYNAIGFNKHGKTELYREFVRHLQHSNDQFVVAPGVRGMVMRVFTLPSYNIVFKLIKDTFDPPKTTNKAHVKSCYKLVSLHDRVGRMADTHEFEYFSFPRDRFAPELLEELLKVAPSIVHVNEDTVVIDHLYTERKMTPLNIFLEHATAQEAEEVVEEYGNTIKQLAAANIFPGDMLLKNFGVTRHRRVVFYDYDEIGFLTDYRFRRLPEPEEGEELYAEGPWFAVG
ncbi:MAG: bifunctional isocitrate dehydrogenase kinase/phosphatase, partial [Bacteroidota bacterium]